MTDVERVALMSRLLAAAKSFNENRGVFSVDTRAETLTIGKVTEQVGDDWIDWVQFIPMVGGRLVVVPERRLGDERAKVSATFERIHMQEIGPDTAEVWQTPWKPGTPAQVLTLIGVFEGDSSTFDASLVEPVRALTRGREDWDDEEVIEQIRRGFELAGPMLAGGFEGHERDLRQLLEMARMGYLLDADEDAGVDLD